MTKIALVLEMTNTIYLTDKLAITNINLHGGMPMLLTMLNRGESSLITRIGGGTQTRQFLESLGFVVGSPVTVVNEIGGNLIVRIKDSRVAISREMARKIFI